MGQALPGDRRGLTAGMGLGRTVLRLRTRRPQHDLVSKSTASVRATTHGRDARSAGIP